MGDLRLARCLQGGGVFVFSGTVTITSSSIYGNTANTVRAHLALIFKSSQCPDGRLTFARCLQGGGVAVYGGTVTISSCTISGNTADYVRPHPQ
jgi:hypothetical protein